MSPLSRGISSHIPSMDSVLLLTGASHPCISTHILIAVGFMILGFGSLETSTLLPFPLYGCWGALNLADLSGKEVCGSVSLISGNVNDADHKIWSCGKSGSWWQLTAWPGAMIALVRLVCSISVGFAMDAYGRKRAAVVALGVFFTASLSRSFAPSQEFFVAVVTLEGFSAQAATIAMLLIATEGSLQKESGRSACLVLIGHSVGCLLFLPIFNSSIQSEMFRQLARSVPSVFFILLIFFLPESIRWVVTQGRLEDVSLVFQRSHHVLLEDSLRTKIASVYNDMRKCLSESGCRGNSVKQSIFPLIFARPLWRVFLPTIFISFFLGSAIGFRFLHDTFPYNSLEDRVIACGVSELLALQLLGLLLARLPVRRVLFSLSAVFAAILLLTRAFKLAGFSSCIAEIFFSSGGHFISILVWVWNVLGAIRMTPTHSRGTMLGFVAGFGTLGHSLSYLVLRSLTLTFHWNEYFVALLYAGIVITSGLLVLILPSTPVVLPDMSSHIAPHLHWPAQESPPSSNQHLRNEIDTRL